jgi:hypothetical protein
VFCMLDPRMRGTCLTFVLAIASACSGEPFTGSANAVGGPASSAGSGGRSPVPAGAINDSAAGDRGVDGDPRGGTSPTLGEPQPQTGGVAGAKGTPASDEGGASAVPECPSRATNDWELGYFPELREATAQESHPFFEVTNRGAITTLDRVVIRYYFTKESDVIETAACYWVTGDRCSLAKIEFGDVAAPTPSAARYLEVSFPGASKVIVAAGSLEVRVGFKTGSAALIQTNDYSFDPNASAPSNAAPYPYKPWLQATLYVDGDLVWGTEPCASNTNVTTITNW